MTINIFVLKGDFNGKILLVHFILSGILRIDTLRREDHREETCKKHIKGKRHGMMNLEFVLWHMYYDNLWRSNLLANRLQS